MINNTMLWFMTAKPNPTQEDVSVQIGCHYEEVAEMLEALGLPSGMLHHVADYFKSGKGVEYRKRQGRWHRYGIVALVIGYQERWGRT